MLHEMRIGELEEIENKPGSDFGDRLKSSTKDFCENSGIPLALVLSCISGVREPSTALMNGIYAYCPEHLYWVITGSESPDLPGTIGKDKMAAMKKLNNLTLTLRDRYLSVDVRKFLLKTYVKDYLGHTKGLLDSSQTMEHIIAMFDIFHLDLTDQDKKDITSYIARQPLCVAARAA